MTTTPISPGPPHRPRVLRGQQPRARRPREWGEDLWAWARECARCFSGLVQVLLVTGLALGALWIIVTVFTLFPRVWGV